MSRVDRTIIRKLKITDEISDYDYWTRQPYEARIDALESIREEYNKWKYHDRQGFQRVYKIIKQKQC